MRFVAVTQNALETCLGLLLANLNLSSSVGCDSLAATAAAEPGGRQTTIIHNHFVDADQAT